MAPRKGSGRKLQYNPERLLWEDREYGFETYSCVLIGGKAEYGNMRKLPGLLWKHYGIVVVDHLQGNALPARGEVLYDIAIVLVDLVSHGLAQWARTVSDITVYAPTAWSHIQIGLDEVGLERLPSDCVFLPPEGMDCEDTEEVEITEEEEIMVMQPSTSLEDIKELLMQLKAEMDTIGIHKIVLELDSDDLIIEYAKQVIVKDVEIL